MPAGQTYRSAGVAQYIAQLMSRLPALGPRHEWVFFTPPGAVGEHSCPSHLPTRSAPMRILWEQVLEAPIARRRRIDVVHNPVNVKPLFLARPNVVTLHDLAFLKFPETFPRSKALYLRSAVGKSVRDADRVITPSESTREDAVVHLGARRERVVVIPMGVDERFRPATDAVRPLPEPFILSVGTLEPRKNLPLLLRAFAQLREGGYPHRLVLIGAKGWMYQEVFGLIQRLALTEPVSMPGYVADLVPWYNYADLFVYPSVYEGFGLPPLEAMACGTPVVTSSAGSLREVVDDAGVLVSGNDENELAAAMRRVLDDPTLAAALRARGEERARSFSWEATARATLAVYEELGR